MRFLDVDWRDILNAWPVDDIIALQRICDEKVMQYRAIHKMKTRSD